MTVAGSRPKTGEVHDPVNHGVVSSCSNEAKWRFFTQSALLFLLVLTVYYPAYQCGFIWDDDSYVTENNAIQDVDGLKRIWFEPKSTPQYYPLVHSTFWIEYRLWGMNPTGYHIVNALLHGLACVIIFSILVDLQIPGAWLAAAVFGIHPVHVETVTWITERKNVLSGLCYVSAMYFALPVLKLGGNVQSRTFPIGRYFFATALYVGALLSKSVTCSLPAACLLLVYWKRGRVTSREAMLMLPWFGLGLGAAVNTAWLERTHVGASGSEFSWTLIERCWIAGHALWFYLGKLLWPYPLTFFYPRWTIETDSLLSWMGPLTAVVLPICLWHRRHRIGRGPLVASLFFGGTLLPGLGFVNVFPMRYSFVADHFQYLASLGPIVLFMAGLASVSTQKRQRASWQIVVPVFVLLPLCVITWRQESIYRDVETLWTDVLRKNPTNFVAHVRLGTVRSAQGRHDEANAHFRESLRFQTDEIETHITLTLLGNSLARQGNFTEAEACLNEALRLKPDDWAATYGLATLASRQQRHKEAIDLFRRVLAPADRAPLYKPTEAIVRMNLGNSFAFIGELDKSAFQYETVLKLQPDLVDAKINLANIHARQGNYLEAERLYLEASKSQPDHPQVTANLNKVRAAISQQSATSK